MNYSNIKYFCTTNGDGVRTALFVSGCTLHCKGCFNKNAWDFNAGSELTNEVIEKIFKSIEPEYISGLSILGGEPLDDLNIMKTLKIIQLFRNKFKNTKDIWLWTGHTKEEIEMTYGKVLNDIDYIIDGKFNVDLYNPNLNYKGSTNQRVWHNNNGYWEIIG